MPQEGRYIEGARINSWWTRANESASLTSRGDGGIRFNFYRFSWSTCYLIEIWIPGGKDIDHFPRSVNGKISLRRTVERITNPELNPFEKTYTRWYFYGKQIKRNIFEDLPSLIRNEQRFRIGKKLYGKLKRTALGRYDAAVRTRMSDGGSQSR